MEYVICAPKLSALTDMNYNDNSIVKTRCTAHIFFSLPVTRSFILPHHQGTDVLVNCHAWWLVLSAMTTGLCWFQSRFKNDKMPLFWPSVYYIYVEGHQNFICFPINILLQERFPMMLNILDLNLEKNWLLEQWYMDSSSDWKSQRLYKYTGSSLHI